MKWLPVIAYLALVVAYGLMTDAQQVQWIWAVDQFSMVVLAWGMYLYIPWDRIYIKIACAFILIHTILIAATDAWISYYPTWLNTVEVALFAAMSALAMYRRRRLQGLQSAREFFRSSHNDG